MEFFAYILKVNICICAFYALYKVVLQRTTFFQWNRMYLLISTLASFFIPLFAMPVSFTDKANIGNATPLFLQQLQGNISDYQVKAIEISNSFSIFYVLLFLYLLVFIYLLAKFILDIFQVIRIIRRSKQERQANYILVKTDALPISSFFKYIFLENNQLSEKELKQIITHECIHVAENHSFDVLFFRLVSSICWFNPVIFWVEKSANQLHEYIADSKTARLSSNSEYARLLLKLSVGTVQCSALNTFSTTLIKSRIMKLNQSQTDKLQKLRFVFAMPMVALLVVLFSYLNPLFAQSEQLLIGTWRGTDVKMKFDEKAKVSPELYEDALKYTQSIIWVLRADGTFQYKDRGMAKEGGEWKGYTEEGKWKLSADKKTIEIERKGKITQGEVIELADNQLVVKYIINSDGVVFSWGEFTETYVKE